MLIALEIGMVMVSLGIALRLVRLAKAGQASLATALCLAVLLAGFAQPAMAGAVNGEALTSDQKELNETLLTTPQGNQYQGIEYADVKGTPLGDQEITNRVESKTPKELKVSVSNGSVRLSGEVVDRSTAQAIVEDIKAIPGVHEVAYDLGLKS
ncbi:MAG: BON domain-containing protein [Nodosilinea sp.]